MTIKKKSIFLGAVIMAFPLYPSRDESQDIQVTLRDLSCYSASNVFDGLDESCWLSVGYLTQFNHLFPVMVEITNNSTTMYRFLPKNINGSIEVNYETLVPKMTFHPDKDNRKFLSLVSCLYGYLLVCGAAGWGWNVLEESKFYDAFRNESQKLKDRKFAYQLFTGASIGAPLATFLGFYCYKEMQKMHSNRLAWLKKHALTRDGVIIRPGEKVKKLLFLPTITYNNSDLIISLIEPVYNGKVQNFRLSLL